MYRLRIGGAIDCGIGCDIGWQHMLSRNVYYLIYPVFVCIVWRVLCLGLFTCSSPPLSVLWDNECVAVFTARLFGYCVCYVYIC